MPQSRTTEPIVGGSNGIKVFRVGANACALRVSHGREVAQCDLSGEWPAAKAKSLMKIQHLFSKQGVLPTATARRRKIAAFSIIEVTVGMGVVGTSMAALFSGFTTGFFTMQMARENLRATQIMLEKTETLRLYSWEQINAPGFIPAAFTNSYDPNAQNKGVNYTGTLTVANAPISSSYSNNMKQVTVTVNWTTGSLNRSRSLTTYVARNGLQSYIY